MKLLGGLPALVILTAAVLFYLYSRNRRQQATLQAAMAATTQAEQRVDELECLVAFGQALGRAVDLDTIRIAATHHLPAIADTDKVWVLTREGSEWRVLSAHTGGADDVPPWSEFAEQLLSHAPGQRTDPRADREIGFPLIVGAATIGVLGVRPENGSLAASRRRILEAAAALLAVSLKNAQLLREVQDNSVRDALTGAVTRAHGLDVVDAELRRARRSQRPVAVILFDLDHFKDLNDRYGHLCGDAMLSEVGTRMKAVLRGSDLRCRYGGDEFLVLLPETPLPGAVRVAETLRREIAERPVPWAGEGLTVTASFGIAQTQPDDMNVQAVIARSHQALGRAKDDGRNCVRIFSEPTRANDAADRGEVT